MLTRNRPDRIHVAFDDHRLVAMPGCCCRPPWPCALGWVNWWTATLTWAAPPGRANTGDKLMTLMASALAGGDCIDDADVLRSGSTGRVLGCVVKAPSTLGTFCAASAGATSASWTG